MDIILHALVSTAVYLSRSCCQRPGFLFSRLLTSLKLYHSGRTQVNCKFWWILYIFPAAAKNAASRVFLHTFLAVSRTCYTRCCCVLIPSLWWRLSKYWWITAWRMCTNRMLRMLATHLDTINRLSLGLLAFHLFNVSNLCSAQLPFSHDVFFSTHAWDFNLIRLMWVVSSESLIF